MGYTLKLSIYTVRIREKRTNDFINFRDFFRSNFSDENNAPTPREVLFSNFVRAFTQSFEQKFQLNSDSTKGIAVKSVSSIAEANTIDGMIVGGLTGVEQDVYDWANSTEAEDTLSETKVTALPYYFKLWTPFDSKLGILMVQSYTEAGVTSLLANKIKSFFGLFNYMFDYDKFVPIEYKERFRNRSHVQELTLFKNQLSEDARRSLSEMFIDCERLKVKVTISGFQVNINNFMANVQAGDVIDANLSDLGMENRNYDIIATYKDESGMQSQAKLSRDFDILPTIILDSALKEEGKEYPNYERIRKHTNVILNRIKVEIEYDPEDME